MAKIMPKCKKMLYVDLLLHIEYCTALSIPVPHDIVWILILRSSINSPIELVNIWRKRALPVNFIIVVIHTRQWTDKST